VLDNICRVLCDRKVFDLAETKFDVLSSLNLQHLRCDRVEVIEDFAG
jgi:hypothetical protein